MNAGKPEAPHSRDLGVLAEKLLRAACERGITLATAESCTGGLISSILTDIEGMSRAFECGLAVYSDAAKSDLLGVPAGLIAAHGAVSKAVAIAMVEGVLATSRADIAVAVTGFAGPAGPDDEPGLVHFGSKRRGGTARHREERFGDIGRDGVRAAAARVALRMMEEEMG